jgi:uncharacterized membrane protein
VETSTAATSARERPPDAHPAAKDASAWGVASANEPRWPATLAVLVTAALNFSLGDRYTLGPHWLLPAVELAIVVPLTIASPYRHHRETRFQQVAAVAVIAIVNIANLASLGYLIHQLVFNGKQITGPELLSSSVSIWANNIIVFALWYWELDRGGPDERQKPWHCAPDFLFPQMVTPGCSADGWSPSFLDYLYVAFTNATAFSPTDTMPLSPWAKQLMMVQSVSSLATITLVAARAVNILG